MTHDELLAAVPNALNEIDLSSLGTQTSGKVREMVARPDGSQYDHGQQKYTCIRPGAECDDAVDADCKTNEYQCVSTQLIGYGEKGDYKQDCEENWEYNAISG